MKWKIYFEIVNQVYRGQIKLSFNLFDCYCLLQVFFDSLKFCNHRPKQIVIRIKKNFTCLIFTSGQVRFMGNCDLVSCNEIINFIDFIYSDVLTPLHKVSETVLVNLNTSINLHEFVGKFYCNNYIKFEPEIFPAVSLYFWSPIHVNLFYNGKIIILGNNASTFVSEIINFINKCV